MKNPERRKPVLIIQHAHHEHPASLRRVLEAQGIASQWIHPYQGDAYPQPEEIRGIIALGGPMGANDDGDHPWIPSELELLKRSVVAGQPVLGVCLGGQLMARALGGSVRKNEKPEIGWITVNLNEEGKADPLLGEAGHEARFYQWHFDTFELPPGGKLLAGSLACPRQAYRIGEQAYGFQFHPEADTQLMEEWLEGDGPAEDIRRAAAEHGMDTIQDIATQRNLAREGEVFNLTVVASASRLFSNREFERPRSEMSQQIERVLRDSVSLRITVEGSHRKPFSIDGVPERVLSLANGEFLVLREKNRILWPIRSDRILTIEAAAQA